jgi:hypothetical protein
MQRWVDVDAGIDAGIVSDGKVFLSGAQTLSHLPPAVKQRRISDKYRPHCIRLPLFETGSGPSGVSRNLKFFLQHDTDLSFN